MVPLHGHLAVSAAPVRVKSDLARAYPGSQNQETASAKSLTQRAKPSGSLPETKRHWLTWEVERGREADPNNLPPSPHRLVRRACDCALDDDRPPCADLRPSQNPPDSARIHPNHSQDRPGSTEDGLCVLQQTHAPRGEEASRRPPQRAIPCPATQQHAPMLPFTSTGSKATPRHHVGGYSNGYPRGKTFDISPHRCAPSPFRPRIPPRASEAIPTPNMRTPS